jgi:hypothetical protein
VTFTSPSTLQWSPPAQPGASAVVYDAIRSGSPGDFTSGATCLSADAPALALADASVPPIGSALHYLVRAQNGCPAVGSGPLGFTSNGDPRTGLDCP